MKRKSNSGPTTTELTNQYIKEHPHIKHCLKKDLINYSSLARLIAKELDIEKKTSKEAILIAARRFQEKLKKEIQYEKEVKKILEDSELEIKNKIAVAVTNKDIDFKLIEQLQNKVKTEGGVFYLLEGSTAYTIITQEKYLGLIPGKIIFKNKNLALIDIKTSDQIETTIGVVSYLTSLFAENGVNIFEFLSCWCQTLFVIDVKDVNKALSFLNF